MEEENFVGNIWKSEEVYFHKNRFVIKISVTGLKTNIDNHSKDKNVVCYINKGLEHIFLRITMQ